MNGSSKKVPAVFSLTPALLISIILSAQSVSRCSDWPSDLPYAVSNQLQYTYCTNSAAVNRAELNSSGEATSFPQSLSLLNGWSSTVGVDELLILSSGRGVVIALIDSGIDIDNPTLTSALWQNPSEIDDDGMDNDGNGYPDDMNGWNFGGHNRLIADLNGHGTNVAGIILRCAPEAEVMVLKINSGDSSTFYADAVAGALYYAVEAGADLINMSLSFAEEKRDVRDAIQYALSRGVMVVNAAGNSNSGVTFPGTVEEVITVGATTADGSALLWNSPRGSTIDITAPGKYVETVGLGGEISYVTGTSFSAPMVSGAIATLIGMNRDLTPETIQNIIFNGARDLGGAGRDDLFGWGTLSGAGIKREATPAITATKIAPVITKDSCYSIDANFSSTTDAFEISCYLPPTDSYSDLYIALVKDQQTDIDQSDRESIWWLDSTGVWRGNSDAGICSIASLRLDNRGVNVLLFSDSGGVWKNFSPYEFEPGSYKLGIAVIGERGLLAPISWSQIVFR